jgi:hypothetical protein
MSNIREMVAVCFNMPTKIVNINQREPFVVTNTFGVLDKIARAQCDLAIYISMTASFPT